MKNAEQNLQYQEIGALSREDVDRAVREDKTELLLRAAIAVSMHDDDPCYAQDLCVRLSKHPHFNVRGNAILGFGHIARVHRRLDREVVQPIIQAALRDADAYVRGQAVCALDDTSFFLNWDYGNQAVQ